MHWHSLLHSYYSRRDLPLHWHLPCFGRSVSQLSFYALSTLTNAVLQGIGKVNVPVINAALALVVQTVVLVPLLLFTKLSLYALAIAMITYSLLMCVLNNIAVRKSLHYKQEWLRTFCGPGACFPDHGRSGISDLSGHLYAAEDQRGCTLRCDLSCGFCILCACDLGRRADEG